MALITFSSISLLTTSLYFFSKPESLDAKTTDRTIWGHWGKPTAEFNWCEKDYPEGWWYVAEPWNTLSSLLYCAVAGLAYTQNREHLSPPLLLILLFIALIGLGSAMFHGSLLYSTQLLDEIPMSYLVFSAAHLLYSRGKNPPDNFFRRSMPYAVFFVATTMTAALWTVEDGWMYEVTRGFLTLSFTGCFIFIFCVGAKLAEEVETAGGNRDDVTFLFELAFWSFVIAIMCWIIDIMCCTHLHYLPYSFPYPHLHALGWHGFSSFGLYFIFLTLAVHDCRVTRNLNVKVKFNQHSRFSLPVIELLKSKTK
ncbi:hypothetical protein TrLO_g4017 [Triparma laevis f. longispina]|uniref:Alkaline phytoceramidase n=1 Tax=Triparma laevis f. longispina TaxID=1714387 RepID=A0A9W7E262_9STRA|nr:hypothetical protein TrLO_g4017 [Triparma laevis f. longispina]